MGSAAIAAVAETFCFLKGHMHAEAVSCADGRDRARALLGLLIVNPERAQAVGVYLVQAAAALGEPPVTPGDRHA